MSNVSGVPRFTVVSTQREGGDVRPVIVRSRAEDAAKTRFPFRPPVPSVTSDISIRGRALSLASGSLSSVYDKSKLFEAISKAIVARGPPIGAPPAPIYALAASNSSVNEGASTNFVLTTANLTSGSQVAYTLSGVSAADVQGGSLTGTATIGSDGRATITVGLLADTLTEGTETLSVAAGGASASTSVNDTSLSLPTYALAASSASVNEGASTSFVLTTANVASGTQVAYTLSGVSTADVQGGSLTGTATIGSDGRATITVGLLADNLTEGTETLSVAAGGTSASTSVNDTSRNNSPPTITAHNELISSSSAGIVDQPYHFIPGRGFSVNGHTYLVTNSSYTTSDNVSSAISTIYGSSANLASWQNLTADLTSSSSAQFMLSLAFPVTTRQTGSYPNLFISNNGSELDGGRGRYFITNFTGTTPGAFSYGSWGSIGSLHFGSYGWSNQALVRIDNTNVDSVSTSENLANSSVIYTVIANDPELDNLNYSIAGGADAALFNINAQNGAITFRASPNFESPNDAGFNNVYDMIVQVSDGSLAATRSIQISVMDVIES